MKQDWALQGISKEKKIRPKASSPGGLAGWLLRTLRRDRQTMPRLMLLDRMTLAPRQTLSLVEAEGRRFLVATSPQGAPTFLPLDAARRSTATSAGSARARVSW